MGVPAGTRPETTDFSDRLVGGKEMKKHLFSVVVLMVSFALLFNLCALPVTAQGPEPPGGRQPEEMPLC